MNKIKSQFPVTSNILHNPFNLTAGQTAVFHIDTPRVANNAVDILILKLTNSLVCINQRDAQILVNSFLHSIRYFVH